MTNDEFQKNDKIKMTNDEVLPSKNTENAENAFWVENAGFEGSVLREDAPAKRVFDLE